MGNTYRLCAVEINNDTEYTLCNNKVYMNSGRVERPLPERLPPHSEGSGQFVKRSDSSCGCVGVFTYDLQKNSRTGYKKMAVMFSVPYDYNLYSNYSAVGIANTNINCDYALYEEMYYGKADSWFHRIDAGKGSNVYTEDDLSIKWKMLDTHEPTLMINIMEKH